MEKITCNACGSTHLIQNNENYVCQNCGTKYYINVSVSKKCENKSKFPKRVIVKKLRVKKNIKYFIVLATISFGLIISFAFIFLFGFSLISKVSNREFNIFTLIDAVFVILMIYCGYHEILFFKEKYVEKKKELKKLNKEL